MRPGPTLGEDEGRLALLIGGVVQSVAMTGEPLDFGYWPHMLPEATPRSALILGLGGGTIASLLTRQFGPLPIIAIEKDPAVVALAYAEFDLPRELRVITGDAFEELATVDGPFDYVAVDLFADGVVPAGVFGSPFLKRIKELVNPGGLVAINFFKDGRSTAHQHRLERVFPRVTLVASGKNLVARCRVR